MRRPVANAIGAEDIWPGFTDALAGILLVLIFLITIFVVTENMLSTDLSGRDATIVRLNQQAKLMEDVLGLRLQEITDLKATVVAKDQMLQKATASQALLNKALAASKERNIQAAKKIEGLQSSEEMLASARDVLTKKVDAQSSQMEQLLLRLQSINNELSHVRHLLEDSQTKHAQATEENRLLEIKAAHLNSQLEVGKRQQARADEEKEQLTAKAASLGEKLNRLMAERVELLSKYRSDFFGKMRTIIGDDNPDIRIIGDRFVLQSEVLFASGSAELLGQGKDQLLRVATLLNRLGQRIPTDIPWVIQISGHTDNVPIHSPRFPSNWELSSARAIHVVKHLIGKGKIPPHRLVATGYGEFYPLEINNSEASRRQNRRIELKITTP